MLGSILVIFDIFNHIFMYFDNGKSIFRPISSSSQILGPLRSVFDHFVAIFIFLYTCGQGPYGPGPIWARAHMGPRPIQAEDMLKRNQNHHKLKPKRTPLDPKMT